MRGQLTDKSVTLIQEQTKHSFIVTDYLWRVKDSTKDVLGLPIFLFGYTISTKKFRRINFFV